MDCQQFNDILSGKTTPQADESAQENLQKHASECPSCEKILRQHERVKLMLADKTRSCRAPADLRNRILTAAFADAQQDPPSASVRLRREFERPLRVRVLSQLKRSPYFAASLFLHGAAAAVIITLLLISDTPDKPQHKPIINNGGSTREYVFDFRPDNLQLKNAPGETVKARSTDAGLELQSSTFLAAGTMVLVDDPDQGCIKAYPESSGAIGQKVLVNMQNKITIPTKLAHIRLGNETDIRIVKVANRLELWPLSRWKEVTTL